MGAGDAAANAAPGLMNVGALHLIAAPPAPVGAAAPPPEGRRRTGTFRYPDHPWGRRADLGQRP